MRLGIDVGSTTVKLVLLDENDNIIYQRYERHMSSVFDKVKELLGEQGAKQVKEDICVRKAADFIVDNAKEAKAAAKKTTKKEKAAEEKPEEA